MTEIERDVFDNGCNAAHNKLLDEWKSIHKNPPPYLYHFTNIDGLKGIISSGNIRATNFITLKDKTEFKYACELIVDTVCKLKNEFAPDIIQQFLCNLKYAFTWYESDNYNIYVTCFCADSDSKHHWKEYAADGRGCAIGFKTSDIVLTPGILENGFDLDLHKVIYDGNSQEYFVEKAIRQTCLQLSELLPKIENIEDPKVNVFYIKTVSLLCHCLDSYKKCNFVDEQEWRLVHQDGLDNDKKHHIEFSLLMPCCSQRGTLRINSIKYGPALTKTEIDELKQLLQEHGYEDALEYHTGNTAN